MTKDKSGKLKVAKTRAELVRTYVAVAQLVIALTTLIVVITR